MIFKRTFHIIHSTNITTTKISTKGYGGNKQVRVLQKHTPELCTTPVSVLYTQSMLDTWMTGWTDQGTNAEALFSRNLESRKD